MEINEWLRGEIRGTARDMGYDVPEETMARILNDESETFLDAARTAISSYMEMEYTAHQADSLNQDSGITPEILREQLNRYRQEFEGVLSIELYDTGLEWEGVIVHMPEFSWVIGIHGKDPAWDSNGYLDWSMYTTGADMDELGNTRHLYLDDYIGTGVADDSKGWSLEQMVAKIAQVIRDKELTDGSKCVHDCYVKGNACDCECVRCDCDAI